MKKNIKVLEPVGEEKQTLNDDDEAYLFQCEREKVSLSAENKKNKEAKYIEIIHNKI